MNATLARTVFGLTLGLAIGVGWTADARQQRPPVARQPERGRAAVDPLTASIGGRVTSLDSGAPVRRAEVRAIAVNGLSRLTTTDGDGRFELRDMPGGTFRLTMSKSGYVTLAYGQRRPFEAVTMIDLKQGQRFTANAALPRGGAIAGRVYDDAGEPLAAVRVQALRSRTVDGRRRVEPAGTGDVTDDTGAFRLWGLGPADYYIIASTPRRPLSASAGTPLERNGPAAAERSTTTFYPGTVNLTDAQRVTLGAGGEVRADIQIGQVGAASVSGIVLSASGEPAADATVTLRSDMVAIGMASQFGGTPPLTINGHTGIDGSFTLTEVPPGSYTLQAVVQSFARVRIDVSDVQAVDPTGANVARLEAPPMPEIATLPVVVTGDLAGLTLAVTQGSSVEGAFVADTGVTQPLPTGVAIAPRWVSGSDLSMRMAGGPAFRLFGLSGTGYLTVAGLPEEWAVKALIADGEDVTDQLINLTGGRRINLRVVLTDRVTTVDGAVAGTLREPSERANHNVVIFPEDANKWAFGSRYVRTARTDAQGSFRIRGLPPGERYLAVAVDFLEDGEAMDPDFLEQMRTRAADFSLVDAERRSLDLRLIQR